MKKLLADARLVLVWVCISIPACALGYAFEAAVRAFRRGRALLDDDIHHF